MMIDIQHDSPVPIHEQIMSQIIAHVARDALKPGALLPEYRAFAQEIVANPQAVARAYGDLEWEGVLAKCPGGEMKVLPGAAEICRARQRDAASRGLGQAVACALASGLNADEIRRLVEDELAAAARQPVSPEVLGHASGDRTSQGIQVLSRQDRIKRP
jgi:GntR family transcriptional regulator